MSWYYVESGRQAGPVEEAQFEELVRTGRIQPETLVWQEGMIHWRPYAEVAPAAPPIIGGAGPSGAPVAERVVAAHEAMCAECGKVFDQREMIAYGGAHVCAGCKPLFMQKLAEGARGYVSVHLRGPHYGGFWIRFAAKLLDNVLLAVIFMPPLIYFVIKNAPISGTPGVVMRFQIIQMLFQLLYVAGSVCYNIFFLGKYGATPGKMVCSLRVITAEGESLTYGRATGRAFAEVLNGFTCNIGYLIAGFDQEKRALHDHICSTRVVYK